MPIFEYECEQCNIVSESLERIGTRVISCILCGGLALKIIKTAPLMKMATRDTGGQWTGDATDILRKMRKERAKKKKEYYLPKTKKAGLR